MVQFVAYLLASSAVQRLIKESCAPYLMALGQILQLGMNAQLGPAVGWAGQSVSKKKNLHNYT
jgi:hypothetical protein